MVRSRLALAAGSTTSEGGEETIPGNMITPAVGPALFPLIPSSGVSRVLREAFPPAGRSFDTHPLRQAQGRLLARALLRSYEERAGTPGGAAPTHESQPGTAGII